ncbi:hypothetical protein NIES2101_21355 [Calothrix sp. HK-06]|nr:hypothetical protein NIES2101_21355 [Calothrix sp. HK-06]
MFNKSLFGLFLLSIATLTTFPGNASTQKLNNREGSNSSLIVQAPNKTVYILLFKTVNNTEGIHTILYKNRNKVLMFEKRDDALVYAQKLEKQNFLGSKVEAISRLQVQESCKISDYDCELVHAGANLTPPTENGRWEGVDKIICADNECNPAPR